MHPLRIIVLRACWIAIPHTLYAFRKSCSQNSLIQVLHRPFSELRRDLTLDRNSLIECTVYILVCYNFGQAKLPKAGNICKLMETTKPFVKIYEGYGYTRRLRSTTTLTTVQCSYSTKRMLVLNPVGY